MKDKENVGLARRAICPILVLLLVISMCSCGIGVRTRAMMGGKVRIGVDIDDNANENSPIAVDVVIVYDEELLTRLLKMTSKEWFENREQIARDYLTGTGLDYWGWEWVPGQRVAEQALPLKPKAKGGVIFANYFSPGAHRSRIDPFSDVNIHLQEKDFTAEVQD
ncbi:MAG: type VI secretion protein [Deltaproteobacteria bacterium]|nr:type VI secretion protein [Deltaproteobacteria bacterium]